MAVKSIKTQIDDAGKSRFMHALPHCEVGETCFASMEFRMLRTTEYTTKCWGSERDINGPWRGPRSETKGTLGPAGAQNLWYDSGYISI